MNEVSEKFIEQANQAAAVVGTLTDAPNDKTPAQYAYAQVALLALLVQTVAAIGITLASYIENNP